MLIKIYFALYIILGLFGLYDSITSKTNFWIILIEFIAFLVLTIGILGYISHWQDLKLILVWKYLFWISIVCDAILMIHDCLVMKKHEGLSNQVIIITVISYIILLTPAYWLNWRFAYK